MAEQPSEPPAIDYSRLVHDALRDVVRRALAQVAEEGLPGEHHFVLAFKTGATGVRVPPFLRDLHPEEMTVVLQRQFWDLEVDREAFSVTLAFGSARHHITVPFAALTAFADPSVPFGLRFEPPAAAEGGGAEGPVPVEEEPAVGGPAAEPAGGAENATGSPPGEPANVVRLDRFRRKD